MHVASTESHVPHVVAGSSLPVTRGYSVRINLSQALNLNYIILQLVVVYLLGFMRILSKNNHEASTESQLPHIIAGSS